MSRHRDIRNMDYSEDYDGYDDVYGHSVDDDIYISPSHRQFMYNRESSGQSKNDHVTETDIQEEEEIDEEVKLSEEDKAKLESCLEHVRSVFAPMRMARQEIVKIIIGQKFDSEKIVDSILKSQCSPPTSRQDKDETNSLIGIFNQACCNSMNTKKSSASQDVEPQSKPNILMFNTKNSLKSKNMYNGINSENGLFAADMSDGPISKESKEPGKDVTISFLCGMRRIKDNSKAEKLNSPAASFLSKMKLHSKETDVKENKSPEISFLSRISRSQKESSAKDISSDFSSKLSKDSNIKTVNSDNFMINSHSSDRFKLANSPLQFNLNRDGERGYSIPKNQIFSSKVPLNGMNSMNDKMKLFLGRIGDKETLEQTRSDTFCATRKSLSKDFSNLQLTDVKSMPALGNDEIDSGTDINLIAALQRSNIDNLKFRPTASEEQFDIPFVDCECDENVDNEKDKLLECTMDLSYLATKQLLYSKKRPSPLGRAFCLKYRIAKVKKYKREKFKLDSRLVVFDFLEPSPDDQIKKHIRRHL